MAIIQSRAGSSLSGMYDIRGGVAGLENLREEEVAVVHEMGATIQSERFSGTIRRRETGNVAQSTTFNELLTDLPSGISRILGIMVMTDIAGRLDRCQVSARDRNSGREMPLFVWNTGVDNEVFFNIDSDGGGVVGRNQLRSLQPTQNMPSLLVSGDQPQSVGDIAFRGTTQAFGAGVVVMELIVYIAFASIGGISSIGLPIPSW